MVDQLTVAARTVRTDWPQTTGKGENKNAENVKIGKLGQ
jgi:hypothetical protein